MKIVAIETHLIRVPCDIGAVPTAFLGVGWSSLDALLVRVVTDEGLDGWGEGFGHPCCPATRIVVASASRVSSRPGRSAREPVRARRSRWSATRK